MSDLEPTSSAPAPMSDAYHKARRNLTLFSAILIFWEYVGVRLGDSKAERVSAELPGKLAVTLENREVIPNVIVALVVYFLIRFIIEWSQCDVVRRRNKSVKGDLILAFSVCFVSITLFVFQKKLNITVADFLNEQSFGRIVSSFIILTIFLKIFTILLNIIYTIFTGSNIVNDEMKRDYFKIRQKVFFYLIVVCFFAVTYVMVYSLVSADTAREVRVAEVTQTVVGSILGLATFVWVGGYASGFTSLLSKRN